MTRYGFSLMCKLHDPRALVEQARRAEAAGFDFLTISDRYHPWLPGKLGQWRDAGFSHVALMQAPPDQEPFFRLWEKELRPAPA